jgi:hypothetical protein
MTKMSKNRRERIIQWDDPSATACKGLAMSGRDYLAAMGGVERPWPPSCLVFDRPDAAQ